MGRMWRSKVDGRAGNVLVKDDPESEETQMSLEVDSTQPGPDIDEKTDSPDKEKLAEDFVEGLSKTGMPLRFMTLDDSERCPVRLISGMMKSKSCETGPDEAPREYDVDKEPAGCNDGHGDDELSKSKRVDELSDSGDRKIGNGDFQGAIEDLSEAIRLDPQNSRCYGLRGTAYYEMGRYEKAIEDDSKAIDLDPDPADLYNRSESFYKTGKDDEALSDLSHALELARKMPIYHDIIPEIHKLVSIIEDKTLNREDYYQPLIGWEKSEGSNGEDSQDEVQDDVGPFMSGSRSGMKICTTCNELYGYTVDNEKIFYQECYCKNKPETPSQKGDWSRFDYERLRELCYCCGRQMIRCGSKYSRFHCDACHEQIVSLNKRCGVTVIPIGRHSVMNGVFMDNTVQRNEKDVARFCTKLNRVFSKIDKAYMWKKHIISENIKKAGFTDGLDVEVEEYLQKVSLLPHDCVANMELMADFVCSTETTT